MKKDVSDIDVTVDRIMHDMFTLVDESSDACNVIMSIFDVLGMVDGELERTGAANCSIDSFVTMSVYGISRIDLVINDFDRMEAWKPHGKSDDERLANECLADQIHNGCFLIRSFFDVFAAVNSQKRGVIEIWPYAPNTVSNVCREGFLTARAVNENIERIRDEWIPKLSSPVRPASATPES